MNYIKHYISIILIISQIFGIYGGMLQAPRLLTVLFIPFLLSDLKSYILKQKEIYIFFFLYILTCAFSMFFLSTNGENALKDLMYAFINYLMFIQIINFSRYLTRYEILNGWIIFILLTIPIALMEISFNIHFSNSKFGDDKVIGGVGTLRQYAAIAFGNYNLYNHIIALAFPFLLIKLRLLSNKFLKLLYIGILFLLAYIVIINASRGTLLCILLSTVIYIVFFSNSKLKTRLINTSILLILIITGLSFLYNLDSFSLLLYRVEQKGFEDSSRLEMIQLGIQMLLDSNLLGVGAGNYTNVAARMTQSPILVPHNMFIELISQFGIFVFVAFIFLLKKIFPLKVTFDFKNIESYILLTSIVIIPIAFTINSVYLSNPYMWIYFATLYVISMQYKKEIVC